ncbi:hypothetical protein A0H81_08715 [Grifola frondosa]|uniref:Uncharacterized protein n=1 Tax=Grifola frondosa TaxID=5627 RepID=A0A1C7M2F1_GRIFR|nr:hypothetical protein A0H81_08715 [Grifola frondosa]
MLPSSLSPNMSLDMQELMYIRPIDRIPPELLIEIFVFCVQCPGDDLTPLTLGQHIYLNDRRTLMASHVQALWWIFRSASLPFDVHIDIHSVDMLLPLLSPVLSHTRRLRRCTISGRHTEVVDFSALSPDRSKDCFVDELDIVIKGISALDALGHHPNMGNDGPNPTTFRANGSLDKVNEISMHVSVYALPLPQSMYELRISTLSITEFSLDVTTDIVRLLNFLRVCPQLHTFRFGGWPHEGIIVPVHCPPPVVLLPCLRVLLIRSTCSVRTILSHIDTPLLTELYLEHTNVDFELRNEPFSFPYGDGDSDDEAGDFSQSPWSDHATGMGLRTLIKRSNPPLEVLDMDYADMRTKDFLWCFDRLTKLREFRIVASDMSDRVMRMLAPFRPARFVTSCAHEGEAEDRSLLRVRLPALEGLEIWHCQRLSGDAIVDALSARVGYGCRRGWGLLCDFGGCCCHRMPGLLDTSCAGSVRNFGQPAPGILIQGQIFSATASNSDSTPVLIQCKIGRLELYCSVAVFIWTLLSSLDSFLDLTYCIYE